MTQEPVKIPDLPGKISFSKTEDKEYVKYLKGRKYDPDKKYTDSERVVIGRRCESMPTMMYPNDNYEKIFGEKGEESMDENMTPEEEAFAEGNRTYGMYISFFDALYYEFRQQTRKRPEEPVNGYKARSLNAVLKPLREMMAGEEYAALLGPVIPANDEGGGMVNSDVMILLTQYKSALAKYRRGHR